MTKTGTPLTPPVARIAQAKAADRASGIVMTVDACDGWAAQAHGWGQIGTAQVLAGTSLHARRRGIAAGRLRQGQGL